MQSVRIGRSPALGSAASWGLLTLGVVLGVGGAIYACALATFFWADGANVGFGLFWFAVALSVPVAALVSQRIGRRRGESGARQRERVGLALLVTGGLAFGLLPALLVLGAALGW